MERLKEWVAQKKEQYGEELQQAGTREEQWAYAEVLAILDEVSDFLEED
jgi:hypothetical protein